MLAPTVNTDWMNAYLKIISTDAGCDAHVVLVLDNAGWHVAGDLKIPRNITLFHLPPYSPELNPVERVWRYMRQRFMSNRAYKNYDDLFNQTTIAWNRLDETMLKSITATGWITPGD